MSKTLRILVVDDDRRMVSTIVDILKLNEHEADGVHSGEEALAMVEKNNYDCVLADIKMPDMSGVDLHRKIKSIRPNLPLVYMTAYSTDVLVEKGLKQGALSVLTKPLNLSALISFLNMLRKECTIVIVDDDPAFCKTMGDILSARDFHVETVTDPHEWREHLKSDGQIVLLDMKINNINGLDIMKKIRKAYPELPVVLVTGYRKEMASSIEIAMSINAHTCLYKPLEIDRLIEVINNLRLKEFRSMLGESAKNKGE